MNDKKFAEKFKALADPKRVKMLNAIKMLRGKCDASKEEDEGLCICDLEHYLKMPQPNISHHLNILRRAELVYLKPYKQWKLVRLNYAGINKVYSYLGGLIVGRIPDD